MNWTRNKYGNLVGSPGHDLIVTVFRMKQITKLKRYSWSIRVGMTGEVAFSSVPCLSEQEAMAAVADEVNRRLLDSALDRAIAADVES